VSKLANQWIDLFRAGKNDGTREFTPDEIDEIVANHDTAHHEPPATIGHPKGEAPAYAWVDKLRRVGEVLQGQFSQVVPEFEQAVEAGRYKKRSIGLHKGPKGWFLHHVAFLGAQAPAVKGLADIKFEDEPNEESIEVDFEESNVDNNQVIAETVFEKMKAFFTGPKDASGVKTFTEDDMKRHATEAAKVAAEAAIKPLQEELAAHKATFSETKSAGEAKNLADAAVLKLKGSGHWLPRFDKEGVPALFCEAAKVSTVVEFGEGDSKKSQTLLDTLVAFAEAFPKPVPTGVVADAGKKINFAEMPSGADPNSFQLSHLAKERAAEKKITFSEALDQVAQEHPELTRPGGATAGQV
jgi:hypothetical protein